MDRRGFIGSTAALMGGLCLKGTYARAETFLTLEQAQRVLWGREAQLTPHVINLSKDQMRTISKAAKVKVRSSEIRAWSTPDFDWFIVDQVIGKHENIDLAVAITREGKVKGLEVLTYRESYGDQIRYPKWREQFHGRGTEKVLRLDKDIRNISGATLSCLHVTEGINRLLHTWELVLQPLQNA